MSALLQDRPQAALPPPPEGVEETWGGPAFPQEPSSALPRAAAASLALRGIAYRRILPPTRAGGCDLQAGARRLGRWIGEEARRCAQGQAPADDYVITSTILSPHLMDGDELGREFRAAIAARAPRAVDWLTHGYECAGWGFVLRYIRAKAAASGPRRLMLQIVDVDIHEFSYWLGNPHWGDSGFGICTLLLDIGAGLDDAVQLGTASQANAMVQMGRSLRQFALRRPGVRVAVPFFRDASRRVLLKCIDPAQPHPDGYERFGHAFGSDPWISLLLHLRESGACAGREAIVNSLALNGYFAIAAVSLHAQAVWRLEDGE